MLQDLLDYIAGRSVLILGFAREGRSTHRLIRKYFPDKPLAVADRSEVSLDDANTRLITGEGYLGCLDDYDLVFKTPGIPFKDVKTRPGTEISGQVDMFLRFAPCRVIGVTGTKGKTTTSTLIFEILRAAGIGACLIGNMGVPVFDEIETVEGKTAVVEMSSHQLEFVKASPHIAVLTNLYPEHLDHYNGYGGYTGAKMNIGLYQKPDDYLIYYAQTNFEGSPGLAGCKARRIAVGDDYLPANSPVLLAAQGNERLKGKHHVRDAVMAYAAAGLAGADENAAARAVAAFEGIEHRLEPAGVKRGIKFYNDSIATAPESVLLNIEAVGDVDTLIAGGEDRGLDLSGFVEGLRRSGIRNFIGLPDTGHAVGRRLDELGSGITVVLADDMEAAVEAACELTRPSKSCLLSPAAASYNRYKSFIEKGRHFKEIVERL